MLKEKEKRIKLNKEVKVLLDGQKNQYELLLSAASLARALNVRLQGFFIEEESLMRAADLSFSREISCWSAKERKISGESVHRILRMHARHKKQELEKVASQERIDYSFEIIHGKRARWIKENISPVKIVFFGGHKLTSEPFRSFRYGKKVIPPLITVFDGSAASERAFKIAVQIADYNKKSLTVILVANDIPETLRMKIKINHLLENFPNSALIIDGLTQANFYKALIKAQADMMIISRNIEWIKDDEVFEGIMSRVHCPVVLVS